jgi:hypothetical protein
VFARLIACAAAIGLLLAVPAEAQINGAPPTRGLPPPPAVTPGVSPSSPAAPPAPTAIPQADDKANGKADDKAKPPK